MVLSAATRELTEHGAHYKDDFDRPLVEQVLGSYHGAATVSARDKHTLELVFNDSIRGNGSASMGDLGEWCRASSARCPQLLNHSLAVH
eukprot:COSAG01_NODE_218_length_21548_cov_7.916919_9_plen_89_part_00